MRMCPLRTLSQSACSLTVRQSHQSPFSSCTAFIGIQQGDLLSQFCVC